MPACSRSPNSFGTTIYFSAGRMLAFPVAGIEATGVATRTFAAIEAASGFGLFALVISLLFSLFSSFQRRETAVVALDALAGAPPSGVQLLETCAKDAMPEQLTATFDEWRLWTVDVIESHLSYPLLFYFRSSHDNEAWANSFGAVMDAATLVLTTVDGGPVGQARLMHKVGAHFVADMRDHFRYEGEAVAGSRARGVRRGVWPPRARGISAAQPGQGVGGVQRAAQQVRRMAQPDDQGSQRPAGALDRRSFLPAPPRAAGAGSWSAAGGLRSRPDVPVAAAAREAADSAGSRGSVSASPQRTKVERAPVTRRA